ncbi:hypothetical protein F1D05_05810 [Kribbella qitaiheensis]|uniref:Uncharacterized protein n=1 Tax=Kribbella qitaiheensis TaxID=1544730 RepID=A0A7G6WU44_9ACTN|nr:hypothetical protein [Kribbella qitaiheensis]QNE17509.1 hypothetical protein F1D05_05810 [Kribbella qitaiheensis]
MELTAYFFERDDAEQVAAALNGELRRGHFQGEDDDEDHPWTVLLPTTTDLAVLDDLLTQHEGWLEPEAADQPQVAPPELPTAPKRLKNS